MNLLLCLLLVCSVVCISAKQTTVDRSNITTALAAAQTGDEFILLNGTYPNLAYVMYGISLSFTSASGNPVDVIIDGEGDNDVGPFMIYYDEDNTTLPQNQTVSLNINGITFVNGGSFVPGGDLTVGGTIYINSSAIANVTVNITNCVFQGGYAYLGGVIFSESLGAVAPQGPVNISISNSIFTGNRANQGIIFVDEATLDISNCTFDKSTVDYAGGIFLTASTLSFVNSNFTNSVGGDLNRGVGGAALYVDSASTAFISRSNFEHNQGRLAGTIYSFGNLSIATSTFEDNQVLLGTNAGSLGGGALTAVRGRQLTIVNCTFEKNVATDDGGALFLVDTPTTITGCVFELNHADHGGAIIFHESTATLRACYFQLNTALSGGAIFAVNDAEVVVDDSTITQNGAIVAGGGIYTLNSSVTFSDGLMYGNNGNRNGGAVFVDESGSIHIESASVTENSSPQGPSIYCTGGSIYILNSTVSSSAAKTNEKNGVYCNSAQAGTNCDIVADNSAGDWNNVCVNRGTSGGGGTKKSGGFPAWVIALIVVLSVAAIVSIAGLAYYISKRKKNNPTAFGRM